MASQRRFDEKTYRATWEDYDGWVQALYDDFGLQVRTIVVVTSGPSAVRPGVVVECYKARSGGKQEEAWRGDLPLNVRAPHHAEHCAVQLVSRAWLDLDLARQQAERQASLPLG